MSIAVCCPGLEGNVRQRLHERRNRRSRGRLEGLSRGHHSSRGGPSIQSTVECFTQRRRRRPDSRSARAQSGRVVRRARGRTDESPRLGTMPSTRSSGLTPATVLGAAHGLRARQSPRVARGCCALGPVRETSAIWDRVGRAGRCPLPPERGHGPRPTTGPQGPGVRAGRSTMPRLSTRGRRSRRAGSAVS